jgi:hypothetical protein
MSARIVLIVSLVAAFACSSSKPASMADASVDAFSSKCGNPGDLGNELGVGKFCLSLADCENTPMAGLCSSIGDPMTHFCTKTCSATGSAGQCGTLTTCTCNSSNQCGCTPNACL